MNDSSSPEATPDTIQTHYGEGNNVQLSLHHHASIGEEQLLPQVEHGLSAIRHRQFSDVKNIVDTLRQAPELTAEARQLVAILDALYSHAVSPGEKQTHYLEAQRYTQDAQLSKSQDIALSLLIRIDVLKGNIQPALDRYQSSNQAGSYSHEAFFELLAPEEDCIAAWETQRIQLGDAEICGLFRGFLRLKQFVRLTETAEHLNEYYPSINSAVFGLIAKTAAWEESLEYLHYWQADAEQRREIQRLANEWADLLNRTREKDFRVVQYAINVQKYLLGDNSKLNNQCWENLAAVEKIDPQAADILRGLYEKSPQLRDKYLQQMHHAETNSEFREKLLSQIIQKETLEPEDAHLLSAFGDKDHIQQWQALDKRIDDDNLLSIDMRQLILKVLATNDDPKDLDQLRKYADDFLLKHQSELINIAPHVLSPIADRLIELGLPEAAIRLLSPLVPEGSLWESQLITTYIRALCQCRQTKSLFSTLERIGPDDRTDFYWYAHAKANELIRQFPDASVSIRKAIDINANQPYYWVERLRYLVEDSDASNEQGEIFRQLPRNLLTLQSPSGLQLIAIGLECGYSEEILGIALSEFIEAPERYIKELTDLYGTFLTGRYKVDFSKISSDRVVDAVIYQLGGSRYKQLIVSQPTSSSSLLLDAQLPLAQKLINLQPGESTEVNFQPVELIARDHPLLYVFQLAAQARTLNNDGSDPFYMLNLSSNPDEMLRTMQQLVPDDFESKRSIGSNPNVPLCMKAYWSHRLDPAKGSLRHFLDPESLKPTLHSLGKLTSQSAILDLHTIIYLGLTRLLQSPMLKDMDLFITPETKRLMDDWIEGIRDPDLFMLRKNRAGGFVKTTAEDIQRDIGGIIDAIEDILSHCNIVEPLVADIPLDLMQIEESIDSSVFSSMTSSFLTKTPWLCIDNMMASLHHSQGGECLNIMDLVNTASKSLPFDVRHHGLRAHLIHHIPFPITYDDITSLSRSGQEEDIWLLSEFLQRYPDCFQNRPDGLDFLSNIVIILMLKATDNERNKPLHPAKFELIQKSFNLAARAAYTLPIHESAEKRFIEFLYPIFQALIFDKGMLNVSKTCASKFASGHFLNIDYLNELLLEKIRESEFTTKP